MWVQPEDIAEVYGAEVSEGFIRHVQSLAESCVGEHETVSNRLKAAFVDVVYRKHLATTHNPEGATQETLGSWSYSVSNAPGLGLTDRDCKALKKAAGISGLWVQPLTRGPVETSGQPRDNWLMEAFE